MKTNRHSLMAKGIMVLLSLLIIVFILTYSWFAPEGEVTASGFSATPAEAGADFEYAIGFNTSQTGGEYLVTDFTNGPHTSLDIENLSVPGKSGTYNLLYDYTPIDITGDGYTLIRPSMEYGNWSINKGSTDYSIAAANSQYVSFDLIIRSNSPISVYLASKSYAIGASETKTEVVDGESVQVATPDGTKLIGSSVARKSDYGAFSSDAIVGAVRVAFLDFNKTGRTVSDLTGGEMNDYLNTTPSLLWVPRPDLYLNNNGDDNATSGWTLNTGVLPTDRFNLKSQALTVPTEVQGGNYVEGSGYTTYQHQQYNIFNSGDNQIVKNTADYVHISSKDENSNEYHFNDFVKLTQLDVEQRNSITNEVEAYYSKVRVRIWIEGTDTEARRALAKGQFKVNFELSSTMTGEE